MALVTLTNGEAYTFGKIDSNAVITKATDYASGNLTVRSDIDLVGKRSRLFISQSDGVPSLNPTAADPHLYIGQDLTFPSSAPALSYIINTNPETRTNTTGSLHSDFNLILGNASTTADTIAGLGFITSTQLSDNDAIGAGIIARRVTEGTAANHKTNLIFATNDDADDDLKERIEITYDGDVRVRDRQIIGNMSTIDGNTAKKLHIIADGTVDDTFVLQGSGTNGSSQIHMGISSTSGYYGIMKLTNNGFDFKTTSAIRPFRFLPNEANHSKMEIRGADTGECVYIQVDKGGVGDALVIRNLNNTGRSTLKFVTNNTAQAWEIGCRGTAMGQAENFYIHCNGANGHTGYTMRMEGKKLFFPSITDQDGGDLGSGVENMKIDNDGRVAKGSSMRHLKQNIESMPFIDVLKLRPVQYNWKGSGVQEVGFIAEEAAKVHPRLAIWDHPNENHPTPDKEWIPRNVNDRALIAALVQKVQELEARLKEIEN